MNPEWLESRRVLQCLGDESRFRVMGELVRGERCVTELAGLIGLSQSCTTRHLQVLERAGLVSSCRAGKKVIFSVRPEPRVLALLTWALSMDVEGDIRRVSRESGEAAKHRDPEAETRPENGSRSERTEVRELEDFLL